MKILLVNKFLYPNGGSESYLFQLGSQLEQMGHSVQYFGMESERRIVGNAVEAYSRTMDFHNGSRLSKFSYPLKTIYNADAARKIQLVLKDFRPDVVHLNNFTYQLTPSVILTTVRWREKARKCCPIVFTAHDYNLICPNHMLYNPNTETVCENCLGGNFINCLKGKCIHKSGARSLIGAAEAYFWNANGVYRYIDRIICPSKFIKKKMDTNPLFAGKTTFIRNFVEPKDGSVSACDDRVAGYVLYFGRFSSEKGIQTLLKACKELPDVPFVFAGTGSLAKEINRIANVRNVGFQTGESLERLIRGARFTVYPSQWYENCPLSVMESLSSGVPVLGADIGGIPELIEDGKTGELFHAGDAGDLKSKIRKLWEDVSLTQTYARNCRDVKYQTVRQYCDKVTELYEIPTV